MAFTDHTWSVGETLTAANMNGLRDNFRLVAPHLIVRKTADETVTSSTTVQNDDQLVLTVAANEVWYGELVLLFTAAAVSSGVKIGWTFPSGAIAQSAMWVNSSGTVAQFSDYSSASPSGTMPFGAQVTGSSINLLPVSFYYAAGGTGGSLQLQWAQTTTNATGTVLKTNSTLWAVKLA